MKRSPDRYRKIRRLKSLRIAFTKAYQGQGASKARMQYRAARRRLLHAMNNGESLTVGELPEVKDMKFLMRQRKVKTKHKPELFDYQKKIIDTLSSRLNFRPRAL